MDWNDLRYFLGVARSGSLTCTAAELRVSQSTVGRRIAALEESLGTRLFVHHQSGYFLTDQGREILLQAETVENDITALARGARGLDADASGVVRLATAENLATHLIIPALPRLTERYPNLRLEIVTATETIGLSRHEADMALRLSRPEHGNLTVRKLGTMANAVYGSKDYLRRHPLSGTDPLCNRSFVIWDERHAHLPAARWLAKRCPESPWALKASNLAAILAAARAGIGLAVLPCFLATASGELSEVIGAVFVEDLWLVIQADLSASTRIRAVSEFLAGVLAESQAALSGSMDDR